MARIYRSGMPLLSAFLTLASVGTSVGSCAYNNGYMDGEDHHRASPPRFCYQTLGDISCYDAPQPHLGRVVAMEPEPEPGHPATDSHGNIQPTTTKFGEPNPPVSKSPAKPGMSGAKRTAVPNNAPVATMKTSTPRPADPTPSKYIPSPSPDPNAGMYDDDEAQAGDKNGKPIPLTKTGL